jgi:hypothetical protein
MKLPLYFISAFLLVNILPSCAWMDRYVLICFKPPILDLLRMRPDVLNEICNTLFIIA